MLMNHLVQLFDQHSGSAMVLLTAAYVLTTAALFVLAYRQFLFAARLEQNRAKPAVILDLIKDRLAINVILKNFGQTAAYNIRISVNPPLLAVRGGPNEAPSAERETPIPFIEQGVESLVPGREIKGFVGFWPRFSSHYSDLRFRGEVAYRDQRGKDYCDPFVIDLSGERGLGQVQRYGLHEIAKELQEIRRILDHIATGYRKPLVRVISEQQHQRDEEAAYNEAVREAEPPSPQ
jgi:hypothetical protein